LCAQALKRPIPHLLVSVRSDNEALEALEGGCDLLDAKEPSRGSLGRPEAWQIEAIVRIRDHHAPQTPVSVALGEAAEFLPAEGLPSVSYGFDFAKLGTAALGAGPEGGQQFQRVRAAFDGYFAARLSAARPFGGDASHGQTGLCPAWIAVAYADWDAAKAPHPAAVIASAAEWGCRGVLIDTYGKCSGGLLSHLDEAEIERLAAGARDRHLIFALAGKLAADDLARLAGAAPDIIGIRSAACAQGDRRGMVDARAVRAFRLALDRTKAAFFECSARL
jgi:(5-formylfuran-3-yl)methyl phosphate synthase